MDEPIRYTYRFEFDDRTEKTFQLSLNPITLEYLPTTSPSKPDWELEEFSKTYQDVFQVNKKMRERLQGASERYRDANTNAVIYLASLGQQMEMDLEVIDNSLEELRYLFVH